MPRQIEVQVLLNDTAARTKMTRLDSDLTAMTRKTYKINLDLGNATAQIKAFEAAVKSLNTALSSMSGMSGSGGGAVKLAKDLGVSITTLNPMLSGNTNAIRTWIHTLNGFGDATVKAAGNLRTTADSFQRFEVTTQNAAGGLNTFVYSINEATGEVFRLDTGVKDSIGNMDRASIAAQRMGVQFSGTLTPGIASSLASMTAFIHAQTGMGSAIVQATGSVTNAAGRWQQFTAAVTQADGSIHTVRYSVNTTTSRSAKSGNTLGT